MGNKKPGKTLAELQAEVEEKEEELREAAEAALDQDWTKD